MTRRSRSVVMRCFAHRRSRLLATKIRTSGVELIAHDMSGSPADIGPTNVLGTWHVLLASEAERVSGVIYFSSAQVFGFAEGEGVAEYLPVADLHPLRASRTTACSSGCLRTCVSPGQPVPASRPPSCGRSRSSPTRDWQPSANTTPSLGDVAAQAPRRDSFGSWSRVRPGLVKSGPNDVGTEARRAQYSPLITKYEPRIVPASFDFCRANLNEPSSAGTSIPSESLNPTARFFGSSSGYKTLIESPFS